MGATIGAWTAIPSGAHEFIRFFVGFMLLNLLFYDLRVLDIPPIDIPLIDIPLISSHFTYKILSL
jgi:hypothetical protein